MTVLYVKVEFFPPVFVWFLLLKELWIMIFKIILKMTQYSEERRKTHKRWKRMPLKKQTSMIQSNWQFVIHIPFPGQQNKEFRYKTIKGKKSW